MNSPVSKEDTKSIRVQIDEYDKAPSTFPMASYDGKVINSFSAIVPVDIGWITLSSSIHCNWYVDQSCVARHLAFNRNLYGITAAHFRFHEV